MKEAKDVTQVTLSIINYYLNGKETKLSIFDNESTIMF
jgi:hypothetical protein